MSSRRRLFGGLGVAAAAMGVGRAAADNPFATHLLALQLSDSAMDKQREVLNNANTVLKVWPDTASIVVVAFGPGVQLTFADSPLRQRVDSLIAQNVEFDVCMNTIETLKRDTGHAPELNPRVKPVPFGVPRLMELAGKRYVIIRP